MRKTRKHENQEPVIYSDFSGGLNLSTNADGIAINELHESINVEVEQSTGRLKTVAGTVDVLNVANEIFAAIYDEINKAVLLVMANKSVHLVNQETGALTGVGTLTGTLYPKYTAWENGVLIASGGKLQYYNGKSSYIT